MSLVLDASVTLAWLLDEDSLPSIGRVFRGIAEQGAVVPGLWWLEVANSLTVAVRRKRIDEPFRAAALDDLSRLDWTTDTQWTDQAWSATMTLADRHDLTLYDAAYLEVALRRGLPLATLDRALAAAADRAKVKLCVTPT